MIKDLESILTAKKINPTAMRLLVLEFLLKQNAAISLTDLEKGLDPADRTTIYRTLKTFEEKGLVHGIEYGAGATKYALCKDECEAGHHDDLHVHFYCNKCKETFCLPKVLIPEVSLPEAYQAEERELIVKGICARCSR
jgi:Fur family transcriptional regulator, ferric uptake regulator